MSRLLPRVTRLVTAHPYVTIAVLLVVTVALAAGATKRAPVVEGATAAFLPSGSALVEAIGEIDDRFGDSGEVTVVTVVFRGEALTPGGLAQMDALLDSVAGDPRVRQLLAPGDPIVAPSLLIEAVLPAGDVGSVAQAEIDAIRSVPGIAGALGAMTGTGADGGPVAVATVHLNDTGDERVAEAERRIHERAAASEGPLRVSSVSPAVVEDEYKQATGVALAPLIGLGLLLIAVLLLLFLRSPSDLLLTLLGMLVALVWVIGVEGWLGPQALGLIGAPSSITMIVPFIVVSLGVDYAIQTVSHYREQRAEGNRVAAAVRTGLGNVTIPLTLAAVTTMASLLASLFSPIAVVADFGVVSALGVGLSLVVMLTLLPAGRTILDRRHESRGTLAAPRPVANALPGVGRVMELLGRSVTRMPAPYLVAVVVVTAGLGFAATGLQSEFGIRDVLPRGGSVLEDMETLDAAVGGSTEMVSVLVRAEATDMRTLLNLHDLTTAFEDEARRPRGAAGPILSSYELLVHDWTDDSGEPGDHFDAGLAARFEQATAGVRTDPEVMQAFLDRLKARDPSLSRLLVDDSEGVDTMLLQFRGYTGDPEGTQVLQDEIEALWLGEDDAVTASSESIIGVEVAKHITGSQLEAISATITVALCVLAIFYWLTVRQPGLAFIAVAPIGLVLIWVLGTMALLGIPYTIATSIIVVLSIGIGVDYTIHVIHRYREEFTRLRDPEQAAIQTLAITGSALLGSALTTALGLGVLVFSPMLAFEQFGITSAITIVYSLLVAILVVPPAMTVWGAYRNMRLRSMVKYWADEIDQTIEVMHERHEREQSP